MLRALFALLGELVDSMLPDSRPEGNVGLGRRGERMAERHLRSRGYQILERNFRAAGAEIDIVASERGTLVFIEVKARRAFSSGAPQEAVDGRKQTRIRRAAEIYLDRHRAGERPVRFDVVAISWDKRPPKIELLRDAF
ncbi:MAG: YraN family protein [Candidatus Binataceae bacterium]